mgnify:CR=1 FL=1
MAGLFSSGEQDMLGNIVQQRQQANQALASGFGKYGGIVQAAGGLIDTGTDAMFGGKVGASDPRMQQMEGAKAIFAKVSKEMADVTSPAFYERLAVEFANGGFPEQAEKAKTKARELAPKDTSSSLMKDFTLESIAKYQISKDIKDLVRYSPADQAKISSQGQRLVDEGLTRGSPEFESAMNQFRVADLEGARKGQSTTIQLPGDNKAIDIPKFRSDLQATVKPYSQVVDAADTVITAINLGIDEGNFVAAKGASTALLKAFGDGQISRQEALSAGADPSIIGGGIDYVNQLFTGTPSDDTMKKIKKTAEALKKINKSKRDKELEVQRSIAKSAGYKDEDIFNIFSGFDEKPSRTIVNTGVDKKTGRRVNKFNDGSVEYAN